MSNKINKEDVQTEEVTVSTEETKATVPTTQSGLKFLILKGKSKAT